MLRIFLIIKSVKNETEYINKLKKRIMIQLDKILHFLAGFFIATDFILTVSFGSKSLALIS